VNFARSVVDIVTQTAVDCRPFEQNFINLNGEKTFVQSLLHTEQLDLYATKEAGPIVLALAFVIAMGGLTAAAIITCGWGRIRSTGINWTHKRVEIVCK